MSPGTFQSGHRKAYQCFARRRACQLGGSSLSDQQRRDTTSSTVPRKTPCGDLFHHDSCHYRCFGRARNSNAYRTRGVVHERLETRTSSSRRRTRHLLTRWSSIPHAFWMCFRGWARSADGRVGERVFGGVREFSSRLFGSVGTLELAFLAGNLTQHLLSYSVAPTPSPSLCSILL